MAVQKPYSKRSGTQLAEYSLVALVFGVVSVSSLFAVGDSIEAFAPKVLASIFGDGTPPPTKEPPPLLGPPRNTPPGIVQEPGPQNGKLPPVSVGGGREPIEVGGGLSRIIATSTELNQTGKLLSAVTQELQSTDIPLSQKVAAVVEPVKELVELDQALQETCGRACEPTPSNSELLMTLDKTLTTTEIAGEKLQEHLETHPEVPEGTKKLLDSQVDVVLDKTEELREIYLEKPTR